MQTRKLIVPTSWDEVTIAKYQNFYSMDHKAPDEVEYYLRALSALTGEPIEELENLTPDQIKQAAKSLQFLFSFPDHVQLKKLIKINGERFYFRTNINEACPTLKDLKALEAGVKTLEQFPDSIAELVSLFIYPVNRLGFKKKDRLSKQERVKMLSENLTMDKVFALSNYNVRLFNALTNTFIKHQLKEVDKIKVQTLK